MGQKFIHGGDRIGDASIPGIEADRDRGINYTDIDLDNNDSSKIFWMIAVFLIIERLFLYNRIS